MKKRWLRSRAVVLGQLLHQPGGDGLVGVGVGDQRAGLIRHQQPGHAADELQRRDDGAHPVGGRLLPGGAGVGVVRRPQHRHEHLGAADLAADRVHHRHGVAGVVDEQPLAAGVHLSHRALLALDPGAVLLAEGAVAVGALTGAGAVLLPQQLQRHARARELLVQRGVVRLLPAAAARAWRRVQPRLQFVVAQGVGQRPVHPGVARVHRDLADGGLAHPQRSSHLPHAQAGVGQQSKCLSDLAHEDPWCGHRLSRPKSRAAYAALGHSEHHPGVRDQFGTLSAFSLERCPPSRRNAVRHHSGTASAMAWNTQQRCKARCILPESANLRRPSVFTQRLESSAPCSRTS